MNNIRIRGVFQVVPIFILWFLWKRRNTVLHGASFTTGRVMWEVTKTLRKYLRSSFNISCDNRNWPQIVELLEKYRPRYTYKTVRWFPPLEGWVK